jgi:hypothetical protein
MLPNIKKLSEWTAIGAVIALFCLAVVETELGLLPLYLLFILLGNVFYRGKTERNLFRINLNVSLILLPLFLWSFVLLTGKPFIEGGDSEDYYNDFMQLLNGNAEISLRSRYILYYIVSWKYFAVIKLITGSTSYLYLMLLTAFISANTAPLLYKIGKNENFKENVLLGASLLTCVFPSLVQTNIVILREGFIVAPFLLAVYLSQKIKHADAWKKSKSIAFLLLTILWIGNIRFEVCVPVVLFFVLYNYVFAGKFSIKNWLFLGIIAALAALFVLPNITGLQLTEYYDINAKRELFDTRSLENSDSISGALRHSGFIGRFLLFFYCAFMPLPVYLFSNLAIPHYYLLAAGNMMWYFVLFASVMEIFRNIKQKKFLGFSKSFLIIALAVIYMLSNTLLGTERHKLYLYPVMFLFFFSYLYNHSRKTIIHNLIRYLLILLMLICIYLLLKY